ncbi:hypothetical protein JCM3766R1_004500 [Sporobolomyces carnicolor]
MARSKQKKQEPESEEEYVVEKLKAHRRNKKGVLEYKVKWKGFDKASDDTWEPSEPNLSGCTVAIAEYWQSLEPEEQLERYKPGSREYKELKAQLDGDDELQPAPEEDDNEQETSSPRQKRADAKKGKAKGREKSKSQSSSPKKKRGSEPAEADGQRSSKRARKLETPEENAEEGEDDIDDGEEDEQDGFEDADKHECDWEDITQSTDRDSWEDLVTKIETCIEGTAKYDGRPLMLVVWKKQNEAGLPFASYADSKICRQTCPQKVIDFYETHLRFKRIADEGSVKTFKINGVAEPPRDEPEEQEGKEGKEEPQGQETAREGGAKSEEESGKVEEPVPASPSAKASAEEPVVEATTTD